MLRARALRMFAVGGPALLALLALTPALPIRSWRTGRLPARALPYTLTAPRDRPGSGRVWIDADAACGTGARTDVDDCLAIWALARSKRVEIVGLSTVFGNAPVDITDRTTRELVARLESWRGPRPGVFRGAGEPLAAAARPNDAQRAMEAALGHGPLTLVALGPLTNVAEVLRAQPEMGSQIAEVVAVMGRREGHLFHPSEGNGRGSYLGHGPVFRDFNFCVDPEAVRIVLRSQVRLTLIPYDAATRCEVTAADLDRLARRDEAGAWISARSRRWLAFWHSSIGREGFFPFDLIGASYITQPTHFRCARVTGWVGADETRPMADLWPEALLIGDPEGTPSVSASVLTCSPTGSIDWTGPQ